MPDTRRYLLAPDDKATDAAGNPSTVEQQWGECPSVVCPASFQAPQRASARLTKISRGGPEELALSSAKVKWNTLEPRTFNGLK